MIKSTGEWQNGELIVDSNRWYITGVDRNLGRIAFCCPEKIKNKNEAISYYYRNTFDGLRYYCGAQYVLPECDCWGDFTNNNKTHGVL